MRSLLSPTSMLALALVSAACRTPPDKSEAMDGLESASPVDEDGDGDPADSDCDDLDATVFVGADEVCDGVDNNCDGNIDEGTLLTWYVDADGDGFGDPRAAVERCAPESGEVASAEDCDDTDGDVFPGAAEVCDGRDQDCDGVPDNGVLETYFADVDSDGYGDPGVPLEACERPPAAAADASDCDDSDDQIFPGATEVCNERDDDCDLEVDEGVTSLFYRDDDGDSYGQVGETTDACTEPAGYASVPGDCDDAAAAVSPAAIEVCNLIDDDCDSVIDEDDAADASTWYADSDGDGYGDPLSTSVACVAPSGTVGDSSDCDDTTGAVSPAASEVCNSIDDDCDGDIDDDDSSVDTSTGSTFYADLDGDGFGDASDTLAACVEPSAYSSDATDCDDTNNDAFPGAFEPCSTTEDLNCDSALEDTCTTCMAVLDDGLSTGDGLYTIDPDGSGAVETWCDMTTDGGGWTLVQRTVWDWSESSQLDTTQSQWHGTTYGDPSPGYAFRMAGALWPDLQEDQEHMLVHIPRDSSTGADCSELVYIGTGGEYTVSTTSTTITSISATVTFINSSTLSTSNSGPSSSCVNGYDATPWFYSSCCTTCPTFDGVYWSDEAHPMASYISSTTDEYGNVDSDVCSSGAAVSSYGYEGVNDMAYFLR